MRSNKRKDTGPELALRKGLHDAGFPGYRLQWKVPGRPDIAYPGRRVAIFVNGCFWHRCPLCNLPMPRNNAGYWVAKFADNIERDARDRLLLENSGWTIITVWECELNDMDAVVSKISALLKTDVAHLSDRQTRSKGPLRGIDRHI